MRTNSRRWSRVIRFSRSCPISLWFDKLITNGSPYPVVLSMSKELPDVNNRKALMLECDGLTEAR